jgi:hypothetical protein
MAAPISLRGDFDGPMLRALVLAEKAGSVTRRLLALARFMTAARARTQLGSGAWGCRPFAIGPSGSISGGRTVLFVDRVGWHVTAKLGVPENITLVPLPSKSPELNPVENIWQYMRDNWLSNRIFANYNDILDHCCFNWNKLVERPWLIMSIGTRQWAHGSDFYGLGIYSSLPNSSGSRS